MENTDKIQKKKNCLLLAMLHAKKGDLFQFANADSTPEHRMQKVSKLGTERKKRK
jgi:hypothetical protein